MRVLSIGACAICTSCRRCSLCGRSLGVWCGGFGIYRLVECGLVLTKPNDPTQFFARKECGESLEIIQFNTLAFAYNVAEIARITEIWRCSEYLFACRRCWIIVCV